MGAPVQGPFIICTKTVTTNKYDYTTQTILTQQYFIQVTGDFPYTFDRMTNGGDVSGTVTIESETDVKSYTRNNIPANGYTTNFEYKYYGNTPLAQSALMSPIGYMSFYRTTGSEVLTTDATISQPFAGVFDGDNHTISNFELVAASSTAALFGYVSNTDNKPAEIKNLNVNNANIASTDNNFAGGIAGVINYATVTNCMTTNSTIIGERAAGIASSLSFYTRTNVSNGSISGCTSANNVLRGTTYAGGIAGRSIDGVNKINDCVSINNDVSAEHSGPITGSTTDTGNNTVINPEDMTGNSFISIILSLSQGNIPDFCFTNDGVAFNKNNSADAVKLARLKEELNGTRPITENIVLPNATQIDDFISSIRNPNVDSLCAVLYAQAIEFSNTNVTVTGAISASNAFNGTNGVSRNRWVYSNGTYTQPQGSTTNQQTQYYFKVTENGVDTYYKYKNSTSNWNNPRFTKATGGTSSYNVNSSEMGYQYMHPGWDSYTNDLKNNKRNIINNLTSAQTLETINSLPDYYKLTAEGTEANPIVVDVSQGGGIYDKGGQLGDRIVKLQKTLSLQNWNALGITKIEEMGVDWRDSILDKKVNFLGNTEEYNDMAVVDWDYEQNNWGTNYMLANDTLPYGKGIFVWTYNTAHPLTNEDNWNYTTTTSNQPILYQTGKVKVYADIEATNTEIRNYISALENTGSANGSGANTGKWFLISNPYIAKMDIAQIISDLTNNNEGTALQGNCIYKYRVDAMGNGSFQEYSSTANIYAGDAFFVAIAQGSNKLSGSVTDKALWGRDYEAVATVSNNKSARNKAQTNSLPKKMTFLCADSRKGLSKMTAFKYDNASNGFDVNDAYAMLSTAEKHAVEPFFVVDDIYLRHNAFTSLPYEVPIGFSSQKEQQVTFSLVGPTDSMEVYLMDAVADTIICDLKAKHDVYNIEGEDTVYFSTIGSFATIDVKEGKNEGKYKIHFGPYTVGIENSPNAEKQFGDINIYNVNKHVYLKGENLKRVQVLNTLGQVVFERELSGNEYSFKLNVVSGAYIVKALNEDGFAKSEKIIVQ
ncbi:MAG: T9SS type A sorting domain-containing protein [Bacteroidales bacterium]|nr:T9SS type A sorting domain-containing protein [Bacteroidales bacterium]